MEIRHATSADAEALIRLAGRDSSIVPAGELLIAVENGRVLAAICAESGEVIADPFEPTAFVVAALRAYAAGPAWARHRRSAAPELALS